MDRNDYRRAFDRLSFSADFQQRTADLLRQRAREQEKERSKMKFNWKKPLVMAAAAALAVVSVSAAALWLTPGQVAEHYNQPALAEAFRQENAVALEQRVETEELAVTLAGLVSGQYLTDWDADISHTYAVVRLERLDGTPIENETFDFSSYTLTPLVSGYSPMAVNNWTLDARASGFSSDGAYYYLLDTQSLEMFAHRTVYLAFYQGGVPSREIFTVDQEGNISFAPDYQGPQALFVLPLDESKSDPAAAQAFVDDTGLDVDFSIPLEVAAGDGADLGDVSFTEIEE